MYRFVLCCALTGFALYAGAATAPTYNAAEVVNLRDQGLPADERATHALVAAGDTVYGATSGHRCHVFRFHPATGKSSSTTCSAPRWKLGWRQVARCRCP